MKQLAPRFSQSPYRGTAPFLIGVSGGMDSMVLLDVCRRLQHLHQRQLQVLHIHHHTGKHAEIALQVVRQYCQQHQLSLTTMDYHFDGTGNFEYLASKFRHHQLSLLCPSNGKILLAHHLRDQVETCLMAMTRGIGTASPLGMLPEQGNKLRPLLDIAYQDIATHAHLAKVPHILDPSNLDTTYFRNSLRHQVLPVLAKFHGNFEQQIGGFAQEHAQLKQLLMDDAKQRFKQRFKDSILNRKLFQEAPQYLWDFILSQYWQSIKIPKPSRHEHRKIMDWLRSEETGCFDHQGQRFWCDLDGLTTITLPTNQTIQLGQTITWGPWVIEFEQTTGTLKTIHLHTCDSIPKQEKELMRSHRVPYRYRRNLPQISIDEAQYSLIALIKQKIHPIRIIAGPPLHQILGEHR